MAMSTSTLIVAPPTTAVMVSAGVAATVHTASAGIAPSLSSSGTAGTARPGSSGAGSRPGSSRSSPSSSSGGVSMGALAALISRAVAEGMVAVGAISRAPRPLLLSSVSLDPPVSGVASVPPTSTHPPASGELILVIVALPRVGSVIVYL